MMGYGFGMGGLAMPLIMIAVTVGAVVLGILLLAALFPKAVSGSRQGGPIQRVEALPSPTEILKQRYARGEISKEQFEQMRRDVEA